MDARDNIAWQATLTPHRSLGRSGFLTVVALVAAINLVVGLLFAAMGAWPVAGFAGLDVLLIWWAFLINFADAKEVEQVSITDHEVRLERRDRRGHIQTCNLVRRWTRVELAFDPERELVGALQLVSGPHRIEIGSFLSHDERKSLAAALKTAIAIPRI